MTGFPSGMYFPQEHIKEVLEMEELLTSEKEPFIVELWENGNYNEYGGELPDDT